MFRYTDDEKDRNSVLKYNQQRSQAVLNDGDHKAKVAEADECITDTEALLRKLGHGASVDSAKAAAKNAPQHPLTPPAIPEWDTLVEQARTEVGDQVVLEDILSCDEIADVMRHQKEIEQKFSEKTSLMSRRDLSMLAVATALQVTKSLLFPYVAAQFDYGNPFDPSTRPAHDDSSITQAHRDSNDSFKNKHLKHNPTGYWINMVYQGVPYDVIKGSAALGLGLSGNNHRLLTLGHDPILGWIFGTADILTDVITMKNFTSYRISRNPSQITPEMVSVPELFSESYEMAKGDPMNLPAAIFAQSQHLKSDVNTKMGLPVPLLSTFNPELAGKLYKEHYDALCFSRDVKILGASFVVSKLIDAMITLIHGLMREENEPQDLYEVRTRKILLLSNSIASSSSIVAATITQNPKALDIGGLLNTVTHLFSDVRFMSKVKHEFIQSEMDKELRIELDKVDELYRNI